MIISDQVKIIIETAVSHYNIPKEKLFLKTLKGPVTTCRQIIIFLINEFTGLSVYESGLHVNITSELVSIYAITRVKKMNSADGNYRFELSLLRKKLIILFR